MIKKLVYIFIPVLAVLFMSHNVFASSETFYLKNRIYAYGIPANTGAASGSTVTVTTNSNYNYNNNAFSFRNDVIWYSMAFRLKSDASRVDLSNYTDWTMTFTYCSDTQYFAPTSNDYFRLTDYYEFQSSYSEQTIGSYTFNRDSCRNVILRGKIGVQGYTDMQLGISSNGSFSRIFGYNFNETSGKPPLLIISPTVVFYDEPNEADAAIQKEKQNVQNAANNSATSGSDSSSNSETATSSLLSVITSGIGAITSASPTNCKINGNMGNLNVGNIDLCANPVPTFMALIGSIIAVLVVLPLVMVLFNRFISIIRSFQR